MLQQYSSQIRKASVITAVVFAIALPGTADAGLWDKAKSRAQRAASNAGKVVSVIREKKPVANALQNAGHNLPVYRLFELVQQLHLKEQIENTVAYIQQVQADYRSFSGGQFGCEGECKAFRSELKGLFTDFIFTIEDAPVMQKRNGLIDNLERLSNLIDYVPPRALYLMWQTTGDQLDELRDTIETVRRAFIGLPPFMMAPRITAAVADSQACAWIKQKDKPVVEWLQVEMEGLAWGLKTIEGFIPDAEVKVEGGGEAGAAVANVTAAGGVGAKPTDSLKIALNVAATVPEAINMGIKIRIARMKMVCAGADYLNG